MNEVLETITLIMAFICLTFCMINAIILVISQYKTNKRRKQLDKEFARAIAKMSNDFENQ